MATADKWYVEVVHPQAMRVTWHSRAAFIGSLADTDFDQEGRQEDTFLFQPVPMPGEPDKTMDLPRSPHTRAEKFAEFTAGQFSKWPDTCQGEPYVIRILQDDMLTEVDRAEGTIGSNKPN